ncbi:MAG: MBOAT family protein [Eubacterium sp.]|nr:MBOAT family protein [Eubacterium sp.]
MLFNSLHFLIFFPVVVLLYFVIPRKVKYLWLLAASYYFYMGWNAKYALLIAFSTVVTWLSGLLFGMCQKPGQDGPEQKKEGRKKKWIVAASFLINLGILFFFKYFDFALDNLNFILSKIGIALVEKPFDVVLPVGISFYTFQALGYTMDVYREKIKPEKNLLKYALFVSFFPQLVAGPIERSQNLLGQIRQIGSNGFRELWDYDRIVSGLVLMLWGYFQKLVIADRLAVFVDEIFNSWYFYGTVELVLAAVAFSIQLYCDFASYSTIAIGAAKVMGFTLMENFDTPYFAKSIQEFWRRWHISLSTWFKDYLYIPLGGSRCGRLRRHINMMITFLVSGLWHGASWHFVVFGAIHGMYQVIGAETAEIRKKITDRLGVKRESFSFGLGQILVTYALTASSMIIFRASSLSQAFGIFKRIFTKPDPWALTDGSLFILGINYAQRDILAAALVIMLLVSILRYWKKETLDVFLAKQCLWFRWLVVLILVIFIFLFGVYGPGFDANQFIYFQF